MIGGVVLATPGGSIVGYSAAQLGTFSMAICCPPSRCPRCG
jgi:hypothetical protein